MDNTLGVQASPLVVLGGLVTEVDPPSLPAGSSPVCCDSDFTVSSVRTRDGIANVYTYCGSDTSGTATLYSGWTAPMQIPPFPVPNSASQFCYNGSPPFKNTLVVPSGGLLAGDTIVTVVQIGGTLGTITDNQGNTLTPYFSNPLTGGLIFVAAYVVLTAPVSAGNNYIITYNGIESFASGEASMQAWRNLGTPDSANIVTVTHAYPHGSLSASITTTANRALIVVGYEATTAITPSGWPIETLDVAGVYFVPQAYWYNGTTSIAPPTTYSLTMTDSRNQALALVIIPFNLLLT